MARWQAVAALIDPVRRALYDYVRHQQHPVTREEAAEAREISRNLAAFHLDKLVEAGLLGTRYQPPLDQPRGRGRTPKVYYAPQEGLSLTIPERRYELMAAILAEAVAEQPNDAGEAARHRATVHGRQCGQELAATTRQLSEALSQLGFEPERKDQGTLTLRNCPFHALAVKQPELICALNQAFIDGLIDGLGAAPAVSCLRPQPGACCVEIAT